jgi:hypothetical protein
MARLKPNKSQKSPNKQQNEEQNKQNKANSTPSITLHTTKTGKKKTWTEETNEWPGKRDIPQRKYERNPENIPYYESESIHRWINRKDWHKQQFDEDGDVVHSSDDNFLQPPDEDAQGNVLKAEEQTLITMNDSHRNPNKEDTKPAAKPEDEDSPPSPEQNRRRLRKQEHESDHMKKIFATMPKTQKNSENREKNTQWKLRPWNEPTCTHRIF